MAISSNLIYGVNDRPPLHIILFSGLQHTFVMSSTLILPVVIISEIGGTQQQIQSVVSFTMIAAGLSTIIQFLRGPVGAGYLLPYLSAVPYFSASMKAAWLGGLPLLAGMSVIAGLFETVFSRLIRKLRFLFPTEVTGVVVLMVGIALIPLGVSNFMGIETAEAIFEIPDIKNAYTSLKNLYSTDSIAIAPLIDEFTEEKKDKILGEIEYAYKTLTTLRIKEELTLKSESVSKSPPENEQTGEKGFGGSELKHVRQSRNIELKEVADNTNISKRYLLNIEEENFAELPARIYMKGFIVSYAKYLGLDTEKTSNAILERFEIWQHSENDDKLNQS